MACNKSFTVVRRSFDFTDEACGSGGACNSVDVSNNDRLTD